MKDLEKTVTENLRKIIQSRNLTQSTLATYAGISESQFSRVMNGQVKLSLNQLAKIASNLEVEVIDIITYPQVYVPKEQNQEDSEVILQLKLKKDKKDQVLRLVFGDSVVEILNK